MLVGATGCESARDVANWEQYGAVMAAFKTLGYKPKRRELKDTDTVSPRDESMITARQEYYIRGLWDLASRTRDEKSLRAMVKRIGGVDDVRFLPKEKATAVIIALRDIAVKQGFNPVRKDTADGAASADGTTSANG